MWQTRPFPLLALGAGLAMAEVVYVTDLAVFTSLAPCAASAIAYYVQSQTYKNCPEAVTALQSCICSQDNNLRAIGSTVSSAVYSYCSSTASEDVSSAATVLNAYCNQDSTVTFPGPATPVSQYITDIPEAQYLAPCAYSALSYDIMRMTYSLCPPDASMLATCACRKNQNSLKLSAALNSDVKASCSSRSADISSVQAVFAAYCNLNNGTSSFPTPSKPPGDMTYYITGLPQYKALASCAASAVSYAVQSNTYNLCPSGPEALASCACIKSGMSTYITNLVSSSVKYYCESTATAQISSAIEVFGLYCSAVLAQVTASGVVESISETTPAGNNPTATRATAGTIAGNGGSSSVPTRSVGLGGGSGTGGGDGSDSTSGNGDGSSPFGTDSGNTNKSSGPQTGVIIGAVVGVVGGLALLGIGLFYMIRSIRRNKMNAAAAAAAPASEEQAGSGPGYTYDGKPELGGNALLVSAVPNPSVSPSPSSMKAHTPTRLDAASPASPNVSAYSPPPHKAELQGTGQTATPGSAELAGYGHVDGQQPGQGPYPVPSTNPAELQGRGGSPYYNGPAHTSAELQGPGAMYVNRPELQGQGGSPYHQGPAHAGAELQGQGAPYTGRSELSSQYTYSVQSQSPGSHQQVSPQQWENMTWQSGPVQGFHEMDGGYRGQGGHGNPGQAQ